MSPERLQARDYLVIALIIVVFSGASLAYQNTQHFTFDQLQMLLKGFHALFTGEYLPWGNEASALGNLPGYVSSFVIGFPLRLHASVESLLIFQLLIRIAGIIIFANALTLLYGRKVVLFGTFVFALSPWMLYQTMLYNPAYLALGSAAAFNCLIRLRSPKYGATELSAVGRFVLSLILVLAVGYCLQLHFSWPVLAATIGIMWLRRDLKVSYSGIIVGIALVALSLWPFVEVVRVNPSLLTNPSAYAQDRYLGYGLVNVYPVFKGLLYWLRFGSLLVTQKAIVPPIQESFTLAFTVLCYIWIGLSSLVGGLSVVFAALCNYFTIKKLPKELPSAVANLQPGIPSITLCYELSAKLRLSRAITISALLAVLVAAAAAPLVLNFWQIAVIIPFAMIPVLTYFELKPRYLKLATLIAGVFFVLANLWGILYSDKFDYTGNMRESIYGHCLTGFSPEQCAPFAAGLTPEEKAEAEVKFPYSQDAVDRVIKGMIPPPPQEGEE